MITYNGIISYFKEFADKHLQINSFSEGTPDQIDLKKINEYPVLHIDITGTDINDKTIVYNVDAYIITATISEDEGQRVNALSETLLIMQDLRAEFYEGRFIVPQLLLIRGSEELSCTPIQEDFNNRVYGWSTSISVTGINEATRCTIPYPAFDVDANQKLIEEWNGGIWSAPVPESLMWQSFYWFSANTAVQNKFAFTDGGIVILGFFQLGNFITSNQLYGIAVGDKKIKYIEEEQAVRLVGTGDRHNITANLTSTSSNPDFLYFALKVKNIKSIDETDTSLLQVHANNDTGVRVTIGSSTAPNTTKRNHIIFSDWNSTVKDTIQNISDGSNEYIREESLTFGIQIGSDNVNNVAKLVMDNNIVSTITLDNNDYSTNPLSAVYIGNKINMTLNASFDVEEFYAYKDIDGYDKINEFTKVVEWLKRR